MTPLPTPLQSPTGSDHQTTGSIQNLNIVEKEPIISKSPTLKPPLRRRGKSQSCHNFTTITSNPHNSESDGKPRNPKSLKLDKMKTFQLLQNTKDRPMLILTMPSMCEDHDLDILTELAKQNGEAL